MKCMLCGRDLTREDERYHCAYCELTFPEELVLPEKRPIITHFEDRQQHKPPINNP